MTTRRISGADLLLRVFEGAISLWQGEVRLLNGVHKLEAIRLGRVVFLVQTYPDGDGWEVFAPVCEDGRIDVTLQAVATRAGVTAPTAAAIERVTT